MIFLQMSLSIVLNGIKLHNCRWRRNIAIHNKYVFSEISAETEKKKKKKKKKKNFFKIYMLERQEFADHDKVYTTDQQ
jgi:hypothetical protein